MRYADNGAVRVGVDLRRGGSVVYLAARDEVAPDGWGPSAVNEHDLGREVQLSFYAPPAFYDPPTEAHPGGACDKLFMHTEWPWNPIGAGDIDGNPGEILSFERPSPGKMRVVTRPMQWACHAVPCECTFETLVDLTGGGVGARVTATLALNRTDAFEPAAKDQELPAVYSNGFIYRLFTYRGASPWAQVLGDGELGGHDVGGRLVGVGCREHRYQHLHRRGLGQAGRRRAARRSAGYLAPTKQLALGRSGTYSYEFHLVLGDLPTIRAYARSAVLAQQQPGE